MTQTPAHDDPLQGRTAVEIGRDLVAQGGGAEALTEKLLQAIAAQPSPIYLTVTPERAVSEARAADIRLAAGRPRSALDGVPFAWKDLVDVAGTVTTVGSSLHPRDGAPAATDAPVVQNAARAGLVTLGKLNLAEYAYSALGQNPHFGTPLNPHALVPHAPGGSSSGSGVAVATGLAAAALGSDTGGSVRIPAAFCGIVGLKTSEAHIPTANAFVLSHTQDTFGPMARSVEDCAHLYHALASRPEPVATPGHPVEIVVPEDSIVLSDLDPAVAAHFEAALARLEQAGFPIRTAKIPPLETAAQLLSQSSIIAADAFQTHRALLNSPEAARLDHRIRARMEIGRTMTPDDIARLHAARRAGQAEIARILGDALLAMPTTACTAPPLSAFEGDDPAFFHLSSRTNRNTAIGSFFNLPGLAIPNGVDQNGLPTSFLLSAPTDQDIPLLQASMVAEPSIRHQG